MIDNHYVLTEIYRRDTLNPSIYLLIIPFIAFTCYCFLLVVLLASRKNKISLHYTFYIVAMIVWSFGSSIMRTNIPPSPLFWNRILCTGLIIMPVFFYHFTLVLTDTNDQKFKLYFGYASAFVLIVCNFSGSIMTSVTVKNYELVYTLGSAAPIMAVWSIGYLILSLTNILQKVRSNKIPFIRVKLIIMGLILVIIGGSLNLSSTLGKYPIDFVANTINAIFIAYSIYRYKFLEINIIVRKGLAYSLYTLILTGIYIVAVFTMQQVLINILNLGNSSSIVPTLIMAVVLALIFQPIRNWIQHWIDRIFYMQRLNQQKLLRDFSKVINNELDLEEIAESMLTAVKVGLQPKRVSLILRNENNEYSLYKGANRSPDVEDIRYKCTNPIVQWFVQGNSLLTMGEIENSAVFTSLWHVERKQLYNLDTEVIAPIRLREQLIGLIVLAEKKGGEPYSHEEMDLLFTLMNNAAVVIENAQLYVAAKKQAVTDGLTKLYNHRHFHEVLGKRISEQKDQVFSVVMVDVDLFKLYNDLYGHSAGDRALEKIADVLRTSSRKEDFISRYGGEEFALILPGVNDEKAMPAMEALRKAVENSFMASKSVDEFLTISVGVASYPVDGTTAEEILEHADSAMYVAKRNGRNQCISYSMLSKDRDQGNDFETMQNMQDNLRSAYFSSIYALAAAIDAKDHYTYGHSENVSRYAVLLAEAAGFSEEKRSIVKNAGLLHDIGKIGIPENILTKTQALTHEEYDIMKKHVDMSITIIKHIPSLIKVVPAIMSHHERYDGKGYPRGIRGENIPVEGRCLCIVDAFDAMTSDRPYRKALSIDHAIAEIKKHSGVQFDPQLTDVFVKLYEEGKLHLAEPAEKVSLV
jgi:diguanylate cyclase (GGDEF)-like protein/putative nucleotidyltransferase with HDIG domain